MAKSWKLPKGATWRQKLEQQHPNHGKALPVPPRLRKRFGCGMMLIPRPLHVDAVMRRVKKGKLITPSDIGARVARESGVACSCPMTTGLFIRMVAEAAEDDARAGKKRITPYWRTIKDDGKLNDRFPGGAKAQAAKLRAEGHSIEAGRGKQAARVKDYEAYLIKT